MARALQCKDLRLVVEYVDIACETRLAPIARRVSPTRETEQTMESVLISPREGPIGNGGKTSICDVSVHMGL